MPPTVRGIVGSKASPAMGFVVKLSTFMVEPDPAWVSTAGDATVTITNGRPVQLYGVVVMLNAAAFTVPPTINITPPVEDRAPVVSTVTVPAAGAATMPNRSGCVGVRTRLASQLAGFGGQAGGQTGPMPPPIPPGAATESEITNNCGGIDNSNT